MALFHWIVSQQTNTGEEFLNEAWSLWAKKIDSTKLFKELSAIFLGSYTIFIEGTNISDQAEAHYKKNSSKSKYLPEVCTISPKPKCFACEATEYFWEGLIDLSETHAEPELFSHFFIYRDTMPLLEWWDSFSDPLYLSKSTSEKEINGMATRLGLRVENV
ncbi:MAG TPA: hypothetical protein ENI83_02615, partial [Gammaproteobacteria bacterium]|nr:hypothetical protein [Gammaproteobacteria bacterium]